MQPALMGPSYVTFSGDGSYLLVSDEGNNCIRKIMRPPGSNQNILEDELSQVETIAGVCGPLSTPHIHKFEDQGTFHPSSACIFWLSISGNKQIKSLFTGILPVECIQYSFNKYLQWIGA